MRVSKLLILPLSFVLAVSSCSRPDQAPSAGVGAGDVPLIPAISINEIMVGQIDHAAYSILDLTLDSEPQITIGRWQELEHYAIQLQSSTAAITMGGTGENDAMWIAQSDWRGYAALLGDAASQILGAARQQDLPAILMAAEQLRQSCDGCHGQFKPQVPTQGFYKLH